jgi:YbbR domain-containing protein
VASAEFMVYDTLIGEPAANFVAMEPTVSPTIVTLSGAERYLDRVNRVTVTPNIEGLSENYNQRLMVDVWDVAGNNINNLLGTLPTVEVAVMIIPARATAFERVLPVRLILTNEPALGYIISSEVVEPQTVTVFGDRALLNTLNYIATEPIDLANLRDDLTRNVNLVANNAITLGRNQVSVGLRVEPIISRTFDKDLILAVNESSDLSIEITQRPMQIMVSGPQSLIENLQDSDIIPYVDLSDISAGEYSLPIRVALPADVTLELITPSAVMVRLDYEQPASEPDLDLDLDGEENGSSEPEADLDD